MANLKTSNYNKNSVSYINPSVAVDSVSFVYGCLYPRVQILARIGSENGSYTLLGGFMREGETTDDSLLRVLREKGTISLEDSSNLSQLGVFSKPERDYRMWALSCAYITYVPYGVYFQQDGSDLTLLDFEVAEDGSIVLSHSGTVLSSSDFAFDHYDIIVSAIQQISSTLEYKPQILSTMPDGLAFGRYREVLGQFNTKYSSMPYGNFFRLPISKFLVETGTLVSTSTRKAKAYRVVL